MYILITFCLFCRQVQCIVGDGVRVGQGVEGRGRNNVYSM